MRVFGFWFWFWFWFCFVFKVVGEECVVVLVWGFVAYRTGFKKGVSCVYVYSGGLLVFWVHSWCFSDRQTKIYIKPTRFLKIKKQTNLKSN